jgi:hypothetical protein
MGKEYNFKHIEAEIRAVGLLRSDGSSAVSRCGIYKGL